MPDLRDDDLARELRELGAVLVTPPPPDLRDAVRHRLAAGVRPELPRRWLAAAAVVLVAVLIAVVPPARTAVAEAATALLRFAGVELGDGGADRALPASPSPLPSVRTTTLDEARRLARFRVTVPARLGEPEAVQLADPDATGAPRVVTLLYRNGTVRLDQFDGRLEPYFAKQVRGAGLVWTEVNDGPAVWVATAHPVAYIDRDGVRREETARLAGSTLIWENTSGSYRLEGAGTVEEAVAIAASSTG
ncbi:MAG TPA: hypothetical protein VFH03_14860 [Actinoplanes sp.]|nr:hypothetical protein [Actinoplanes sp.]